MFLFYIATLAAVLAMSTACLTATESGYFSFQQDVRVSGISVEDNDIRDISVDYEVRRRCCTIVAGCGKAGWGRR